jgi:acetyltransferase
MTIRNLRSLFEPRAIAVIGASKSPASVGHVLAHNLFRAGFDGPIMPVNPQHGAVEGVLTYPDVDSLPVTPDLAVIATPPDTVPGLIDALGRRGTRAAVVITADPPGAPLRAEHHRAMLAAARPHLLRIVGPGSLGVMAPARGINASVAHLSPRPGSLAFVTQSGTIETAMLDWAAARGIGFSRLVSLGDTIDVDLGDLLDYLADDPATRAILMYMESAAGARKFMSAARAAARSKPVIVVKAGRSSEGAAAAALHTGAVAGVDAVYDAVFRRAGMLRVHSLAELFEAAEILTLPALPRGNRLAILTNGGGIGVMATDALVTQGGRLATLSPATLAALDQALPPAGPRPGGGDGAALVGLIDVGSDASGARYGAAVRALLGAAGGAIDALLVLHCPTGMSAPADAARAVLEAYGDRRTPPLLTSWVGADTAAEARRLFAARRVPSYETPEQAVRAFLYMVEYGRSQEALMETPPSQPPGAPLAPLDRPRVRRVVARALAERRDWLDAAEVADVLSAYGVPVVPAAAVRTPDEAGAAADALARAHAGPLVLKIRSPDIVHKSDIGGVALGLDDAAAVRAAAERMLAGVSKARPDARIDGFTVAAMIRRPSAFELYLGATVDPQFGPVMMFGHGGTAAELIGDLAVGLPPLNMHLARELMSRTRIHRLLQGYRDHPRADLDAVAVALIHLAQLVIDVPEVIELDINPLLADAAGIVALDARIRVAPAAAHGAQRLAIRPYPSELEEAVDLPSGARLLLRPIRPEDEPSLQDAFARLTPEQIRLRFFIPLKTLTHVMAARFTQIDYDRDMALVLTDPGLAGTTAIYGVVSLNADPDGERGEYAILVRDDMTRRGLGALLMRRIIAHARARGLGTIYGDVLRENEIMRKLCRKLGFREDDLPDDPGLVRVVLPLA